MDADMALAAAYAAGGEPPPRAFAAGPPQQQGRGAIGPPGPRRQQQPRRQGQEEGEEAAEGELPSIDDMDVAAAAAGVAPVPAVLADMGYFDLGRLPEREGGEDQRMTDANGSIAKVGAAREVAEHPGAAGAGSGTAIKLELQWVGEDEVAVLLVYITAGAAGTAADGDAHADMEAAEVASDSSYDSSSEGSSSSSSEDEAEGSDPDEPLDIVQNYDDIKKMIDDMDADEDGGGGGGGAAGGDSSAHRAEQELLGALPLPSLAELSIGAEDAIRAAGTVQTLLEGMIVIKAQGGSRALNEGCLLCLDDRTPIGCIEEIFGPVVSPLYALRYGGADPKPASLVQGALVYSVDRLADFVLPEELRVRGYDVGMEEEEDADLDLQFSDDEAEAEHRRKLKAKRKEQPAGMALQGSASGRGAKQGGRGGGGGNAGGGGGRGGRNGGGGGGRGGGRGGGGRGQQQGAGMQPPVASYHPHQQQQAAAQPPPPQLPPAGRLFSGRLPRPPPAFQGQAAPSQFNGMQGMQMQMQAPGGACYAGQPPPPPRPAGMGQVLRAQYAGAPQQYGGVPPPRPHGMGPVMQAQYSAAGRPMMQQQMMQQPAMMQQQQQQYMMQQQQQQAPMFTPKLPMPPPPPQQQQWPGPPAQQQPPQQ